MVGAARGGDRGGAGGRDVEARGVDPAGLDADRAGNQDLVELPHRDLVEGRVVGRDLHVIFDAQEQQVAGHLRGQVRQDVVVGGDRQRFRAGVLDGHQAGAARRHAAEALDGPRFGDQVAGADDDLAAVVSLELLKQLEAAGRSGLPSGEGEIAAGAASAEAADAGDRAAAAACIDPALSIDLHCLAVLQKREVEFESRLPSSAIGALPEAALLAALRAEVVLAELEAGGRDPVSLVEADEDREIGAADRRLGGRCRVGREAREGEESGEEGDQCRGQ